MHTENSVRSSSPYPDDLPPSYEVATADNVSAYRRNIKRSESGHAHIPGNSGFGLHHESGPCRSVSFAPKPRPARKRVFYEAFPDELSSARPKVESTVSNWTEYNSTGRMPMDRFRDAFTPEQQQGIQRVLGGSIQGALWLVYRLAVLKDYELDFIIDNSVSMDIRDGMVDPETGSKMSRMQEACKRMSDLAKLLAYIPVKQITLKTFTKSFPPVSLSSKPDAIARKIENYLRLIEKGHRIGRTPLYSSIDTSFRESGHNPRITYVFNDGEPNYGGTVKDICDLLHGRDAEKNPVCLIACTDDQNSIGWMNETDGYSGIHVVDDFRSEMKQVKAKQGQDFPFTDGFYAMSTLLGPVDPLFDKADENHIYSYEDYQEIIGHPVSQDEYRQYRVGAEQLQNGLLFSLTRQLFEQAQNAWAQCTIL